MRRTQRMSFCLRAATTLHADDLDQLTTSIENYLAGGASVQKAEALAIEDVMAQLKADRAEVTGLLKQQHPDVFKAAPASPGPGAQEGAALFSRRVSAGRRDVFARFDQLGDEPGTAAQGMADAASLLNMRTVELVRVDTLAPYNPAAVDVNTGTVLWNPNYPATRSEWAQFMAEEVVHAADLVGVRAALSPGSVRLAPDGDLRREAQAVYDAGRGAADWLSYPLHQKYKLSEPKTRVELFARLAVFYHGDAARMHRELPIAYEAIHALFGTTQRSPGEFVLRDVRRAGARRDDAQGSGGRADPGFDGGGRQGNGQPRADQGLEQLRDAIAEVLQADRAGTDVGPDALNSRVPDDYTRANGQPDPNRVQEPASGTAPGGASPTAPGRAAGAGAAADARVRGAGGAVPGRARITPDTDSTRSPEVQRIADAIRDGWANSPRLTVFSGMQDPALDPAIRAENDRQLSRGAVGSEPQGIYWRGTVYLNANALRTEADVVRVMLHESLGHAGLRGVFGPDLNKLLEQISGLNRPAVALKAKQYGLDMTKQDDRRMAAEEVLAELAQTRPSSTWVTKAVAMIRAWLRENVPYFRNMQMSDSELIEAFLVPARGFIERGRAQDGASGTPVFNRPANDGMIQVQRMDTPLPDGRQWVATYSENGNERITFHASEADARAAMEAVRGTDASREGGSGRGEAKGVLPAGVHRQEFVQPERDRPQDRAASGLGLSERAARVLAQREGTALQSKKEVDRLRLSGSLKQAPGRTKLCYSYAAAASIDGLGDMVIGVDQAPDGQREWHAVVQRDRYTYDPTMRQWFAPGIYEATGFSPRLTLSPSQVRKFVTGNGGMAPDARNQGLGDEPPMFSRPSHAERDAGWTMPGGGKFDNFVYKFQDKQIDLKRAIGAIKAERQTKEDRWDAYLQEELFHGRAAKRTEDFVSRELEPLLKDMALKLVALPQLEQYLHARHAKEANELIAERNKLPNDGQMNLDGKPVVSPLQDGGSGMMTQVAKDYLAGKEVEINGVKVKGPDAAQRKRLEDLAQRVDDMIAKTRQTYVDYGLESKTTVNGWAGMFQHYVPLMRKDKDGGMGVGQGFSIKGRETKGRTGSTDTVVDILANIALQRERAIVRGEKNRVAVALAGLVKLNPNPEMWQLDVVPTTRTLDRETNTVVERPDFNFKNQPNVLVAKILDRNGQVQERAVVFNESNERAVRMAEALKNLDAAQLEGVMSVMSKATRYFAAINTQYNPIFGTVNLVRDVQGAALNLGSTALKEKRMAVMSNIPSALRTIYRTERDKTTKNAGMAALWEDLQLEGGMTGFREQFRTSEDRADAIRFAMDPTNWTEGKWGKVFTAGGLLKVPLTTAQKLATPLFTWLSDYNQAMEGATRLAAYKVALEQGLSKQQAASIAKNMTVNFNRKGQVSMQAGALYAFFNASVQGTARMGEVLVDTKGGQGFGLKPAAYKIVGGGILLGAMQAALLAAMGFEDDEPPEFVRERNMIIPIGLATGKKDYIAIPMPLGWHVFPNIGRISTEFVLDGFKDPAKRLAKLFVIMAESFNPIGSTTSVAQFISPTVFDPIVALSENKDWTGKPIARTSFDRTTPGFQQARDTASAPSKWLAETLNYVTGGTRHTRGGWSPTPDQIDYLFGQLTGGVGREVNKTVQSVSAKFTGEELPPHKVPLVGRFYGTAEGSSAEGSRFYNNMNRMAEHKAMLEGFREEVRNAKTTEDAEAVNVQRERYRAENPETELAARATVVERRVRQLRREKREALKQNAPRAQVKAIEDRITERMRQLNEAIKTKEAPKPLRDAIRMTPAISTSAKELEPA